MAMAQNLTVCAISTSPDTHAAAAPSSAELQSRNAAISRAWRRGLRATSSDQDGRDDEQRF
jgi:hypothetical protein